MPQSHYTRCSGYESQWAIFGGCQATGGIFKIAGNLDCGHEVFGNAWALARQFPQVLSENSAVHLLGATRVPPGSLVLPWHRLVTFGGSHPAYGR